MVTTVRGRRACFFNSSKFLNGGPGWRTPDGNIKELGGRAWVIKGADPIGPFAPGRAGNGLHPAGRLNGRGDHVPSRPLSLFDDESDSWDLPLLQPSGIGTSPQSQSGKTTDCRTGALIIPGGGILTAVTTPGYRTSKEQLLKRLVRIEGQVRGVRAMVDEERYCIDVLTQISAIRSALDRVALGLVDDHARNCMREPSGDGDERVDELMGALGRMLTL